MDLQAACRAHGNDFRMGKGKGARGTCESTATPVIASRSNEGGAVCDPTTSAPFQRWRTARTHRRRILCTTKWKPFHWRCEHITKQKAYEPRLHSSTLLAATYGSLRDTLRPAHDRQGCTEYGVAHRQGCFGRCYGLSMLPSTQAANREGTAPSGTAYKPVRSRTTESGDTAQSSWSARWYAELKVLSSLLH